MKKPNGTEEVVFPENMSEEQLEAAKARGARIAPKVWVPDPAWIDRELNYAQALFVELFKRLQARANQSQIMQQRHCTVALHAAVLAANADLLKTQVVEPARLLSLQAQTDMTRHLLALHAEASRSLVVPAKRRLQ
jgi:hypothetical protein